MAIFYHNGNYFEIIEGTDEVILRRSGEKSGDVILPKYAMYNDKRYTVTKIIPQKVKVMENLNAEDKRKKPDWRETPYTRDASLFCRVERYYDSDKPVLMPKLDITSILIPSTVTEIGDYAFANCSSLTSLNIPDSVTSIGVQAFSNCTSLKSLTIPDSVTSIGDCAFVLACGLESLRLSSNVKKLRDYLFGWAAYWMGADQRNPNSIKIEIPSIVEEIGQYAFNVFQNAEIIIYNEPGEVMVATNAFAPTASVKYVCKKAKADKKETPKQEVEQVAAPAPTIDLDKLIEAVVADGVITDKERAVILKKATAAGYDADEVEILLDGKLAEKQSASQPTPKATPKAEQKVELKPEPKPEPKAAAPVTNGNGLVLQKGTVVADLKATFNARFGAKLRVYSGRSQAEQSATLGELGLTNEGNFECQASLTVGSFIKRMQSEHGLKVKVYTPDEWVAALDGLTLESAGKVKKNASKADMESMIAYQRTDDATETAVVDIKKSATYGDYTINIASNNSVTVLKNDVACDNVKGALREIAEKEGFEYDPSWTTRQFGSKLVDFLNEKK
ncbi:MAG: hypothetical protein E7143_00105 [Rikenellaceae bacterium]|nr:hypothetical protein [Rikenellaceae bacterium]